jgi:hypothetical protein
MNNTDISRSVNPFNSLAKHLKAIQNPLYNHPVKILAWNGTVLIYKSHIFYDVRTPRSLFKSLKDNCPGILIDEKISYESVYHVVLFAYDRDAFNNDKDAAYESGRQLLEKGERLKHWYQRFNCSKNVSAPVLHDKTRFQMPSWFRSQGKRLNFGWWSKKYIKLTWEIENDVSGARTYPSQQRINLKSKMFTERTDQVTLEWREIVRYNETSNTNEYVTRWGEVLSASATTQNVLQCIYNACKPSLEQSGMSLSFQRLWKEGEGHYIVELARKKEEKRSIK